MIQMIYTTSLHFFGGHPVQYLQIKLQGINKLEDPLLDMLSKYNKDRTGSLETTWNDIQKELKCCGVNSPKDWTQ